MGIFSSYGGDDPSKLVFVQRRQDTCLVTWEISIIFSTFGRAIRTLPEVRRDTQDPFPVPAGILEFLSIFKKSKASSPFEALNSACL